MRPFALVLVALLAGAIASGCGDGCDVGSTWCDGDVILVCVADQDDDWDDGWEEDDEEEDDLEVLLALIDLFIELSDDHTHVEVLTDCWDQGKTCVERYDADDEPFAECGFGQQQ
jgi:hypothetical protein